MMDFINFLMHYKVGYFLLGFTMLCFVITLAPSFYRSVIKGEDHNG